MKQYCILFCFFLLILSCEKATQQEKVIAKKPEMSIISKHKRGFPLKQLSAKKVKDWKEYNELNNFLERFENTSPNEALSNALELKKITKRLKDSIRITDFKTDAFKARINVLENETLRLADMTYIPAITAKEINAQIDKIFLVFGSVNAKINTIFNKKRLDEDFNLENFLKLDSSEIKKPREEDPDFDFEEERFREG